MRVPGAVDQLLCLFLQGVVYRSRDTCSGGKGGKPFEQVRGFVGQRHGRFGKRFEERQSVFGFVQYPSLLQGGQELVAFGFQPCPVTSGMDQGGRVGQDGECGALGPREVGGASPEIAPGRRLDAYHIPSERSVRGIEVQDLMFVEGCFQEKGIAGFDHFFIQGTVAVAPRDPCQLHGDRAPPADDLAPAEVDPHGSDDGNRVYSRMPEETFVFVGQQAGHELAGKTVCRRETPLPVRCDPCP